jgi:thiol-disulfide isomerase/thioredoxin
MRTLSAILAGLLVLITLSACANTDQATMAIGEVNQQQLLHDYVSFDESYQNYKLTDDEVAEINRWPTDLHVEVFFGTWCHDSQREVPKFLKIITENNAISNQLFALDYQKSEPSGATLNKNIKYTPTFIVYRNNIEVGRIIERPKQSLTADITAML